MKFPAAAYMTARVPRRFSSDAKIEPYAIALADSTCVIDIECGVDVEFCMHAVAETSIFTRRADALLSREDRTDLITVLAGNPAAGDLVPGMGGIRKLRFAPTGRGKSGAFRVIYYLAGVDVPVLALLIYAKNEQDNISADQRKALVALIRDYKAKRRAQEKG